MNRKITFLLITMCLFAVFYKLTFKCDLTDSEAIGTCEKFCSKLKVKADSSFFHVRSVSDGLFRREMDKEIVVGKNIPKIQMRVSCNNNEVTRFTNYSVRDYVLKKYNIKKSGIGQMDLSKVMSEDKAKEMMTAYMRLLNVQMESELDHVYLDKVYDAVWTSTWKLKYNGYIYENGHIDISIMAIDGELFHYTKSFVGRPCSTKVTVSENAAKEIAKRKIQSILNENNALNYIVASTDLKIVQPNAFLGIFTPFSWHKSRLAWVVRCNRYIGADNIADGNLPDFIIIKVDAATGKVIGGKSAK